MKQVPLAAQFMLSHDPLVEALVGRDSDGLVKVYLSVAKAEVQPPYVVIQVIPGQTPAGTYKDPYAIENLELAITSWAETSKPAWALAETVDDAFISGEWNVELEPYHLMIARRTGFPQELPDRDTEWRQVISTYRVGLGR